LKLVAHSDWLTSSRAMSNSLGDGPTIASDYFSKLKVEVTTMTTMTSMTSMTTMTTITTMVIELREKWIPRACRARAVATSDELVRY
jgi:hypothetical protein